MDTKLNTFIHLLKSLLKKTFPEVIITITQSFPFPNEEYGKLDIIYSNVKNQMKFRKEIYNCFMYLCDEGTTTNMGYWFRIGDHYYQYELIRMELDMDVEKVIRLTLSEEDTKNLINEIQQLEDKFDKEYSGSPYHEIDALRKLKGCIMLVQGSSGD